MSVQKAFALPAYAAIFGLWLLAWFPDPRLLSPERLAPDKITLLFLFAAFSLALFPSWRQKFLENRDAATFLTLAALVALFHIADRGGPREGWSIEFPFASGDPVFVSWATRFAVLGALLSVPAWLQSGAASERFFFAGVLGLGILGLGTLFFLGNYYPIGLDKTLDPTPTAQMLVQLAGFASLGLLARAVTQDEKSRLLAAKVLPILLLIVWARHQFSPVEAPLEEDE